LGFDLNAESIAVVGLGNPGQNFKHTRHNVGFEAVDLIARSFSTECRFDKYLLSEVAQIKIKHYPVLLVKPQTFMNDSGQAVKKILSKKNIGLSSLIVVHDELDIEPGKIKIKFGGGSAGHNGLQSIFESCKSRDFVRIRIGIGKPDRKGVDYVLSNFSKDELPLISQAIEMTEQALLSILDVGLDQAQNMFN
jgi:PTH1 family peptidyl-tRNA hydrolase